MSDLTWSGYAADRQSISCHPRFSSNAIEQPYASSAQWWGQDRHVALRRNPAGALPAEGCLIRLISVPSVMRMVRHRSISSVWMPGSWMIGDRCLEWCIATTVAERTRVDLPTGVCELHADQAGGEGYPADVNVDIYVLPGSFEGDI
jgi:hypothetical protein